MTVLTFLTVSPQTVNPVNSVMSFFLYCTFCTFCTFAHQNANSANSAMSFYYFFRTPCSKIRRWLFLYILSHLLSITEPIACPFRLNVGSIAPKSADLALITRAAHSSCRPCVVFRSIPLLQMLIGRGRFVLKRVSYFAHRIGSNSLQNGISQYRR